MKISLPKGVLEITNDVLCEIITAVVSGCFGVRGMAAENQQGIIRLIKRENVDNSVKVTERPDGTIKAELHIIVRHGVNINAVCRSINEQVRYSVEDKTGIKVSSVDICVDSVMSD